MENFKERFASLWQQGKRMVKDAFIAKGDNVNLFHYVYSEYHRDLSQGKKFLVDYVKTSEELDLLVSPGQRFVKDQCKLFCEHIHDHMKAEILYLSYFQDGIENLYFLGHYWKLKDPAVSTTMGKELSNIIQGLESLLDSCERAEGSPIMNWTLIASTIKSELVQEEPSNEESFVPAITDLRLDRLVGAGGFGAVFKAYLGEATCAVKVVPKSMLPEIRHAIVDKEIATMVNHPCLVRYFATFVTEEAFVTVMEYVRGVDVIRLLRLSTRLSTPLIRLILAQLGLALYHLHCKGFIHRDVKPSNLMITMGCRVKLIDFDTARICIGKYTKRSLPSFFERTAFEHKDDEIAGTVFYMAPEMLKLKAYGRAIDWWSFGATAYELVTGKLPFKVQDAQSFEEQKSVICKSNYEWPKGVDVSKDLKSLIRTCLFKDPALRFCSRSYNEFPKHPFFHDVDLRWVETTPEIMKFDPLTSVAVGTLTYNIFPDSESPTATPTAEYKCGKLFPGFQLTETDSQMKLFTYASPGYEAACRMVRNSEMPSVRVVYTHPEFVDFNEEKGKFFFSNES